MTGRTSRAAVALRAAALAVTAVSLAAAGHVVAGGAPPPPRLMLVIGAVAVVAARPLARGRLRTGIVVPWVLVAQVAIHLALSWLVSAHTTSVSVMSVTAHHGTQAVSAAGHHAAAPSVPMLLAHLAATLVTVALLVGVDGGADRVGTWWRRVVVLTTDQIWSPVPRDALSPVTRTHRAHGRRPGMDVPRRGPPLAIAV